MPGRFTQLTRASATKRIPSRGGSAPTSTLLWVQRSALRDRMSSVSPADLVGLWDVTAEGQRHGVVLGLLLDQLVVVLPEGQQYGDWRAHPTDPFIPDVSAWSTTLRGGRTAPQWLSDANSYRTSPDSATLLRDGVVLATLTRQPPDQSDPRWSGDVAVTEEVRAQMNLDAALPESLEPVVPERLSGRWVPAGGVGRNAPRLPFLAFATDGRWTGSDGCNNSSGRWRIGAGGVLLSTHGAVTLAWRKDMVHTAGWLQASSLAGLDGDVLVMLDGAGTEVARLERASAPDAPRT